MESVGSSNFVEERDFWENSYEIRSIFFEKNKSYLNSFLNKYDKEKMNISAKTSSS